ncbi:division/cell wall cluster transcriptional repressor MraZ [bacterium]|nr:division/cell wall cluster transcriptional repressor MraZ [bacterium]
MLSRQIFANSNEVEIDKAKRILLPTNLKDMASIKKDVMIIGVGNKIEI